MITIKWLYTAKDSAGRKNKGFIYANTREEATKKLRDKGYRISRLNQDFELNINIFKKKMTDDDMSELFSNLAILMEAGLSVTDSWEIIMNKMEKEEVKVFMKAIFMDITSGKSLYMALRREADMPKLVLAILKAGEKTGELVKAFEHSSLHFSQKNVTMSKLKSAMFYPVMTIGVGLATMYGISVKVMPQIMGSMGDNVKINIVTEFLLAMSGFFQTYKLLPFVVLGIFIAIMSYLAKTKLKKQFDYFIFNIPYIGSLIKKNLVLTFIKTYIILYESDVKIIEILKILKDASDNYIYQENLDRIIEGVNNGEPVSRNLSQEIFDVTVINIFKVSEETGEITKSFQIIAKRVEQEVDLALKKLLQVIGPFSTIILSLLVLTMVIGILAPIFSIYDNVSV